ncbi:kinase-like domain-containing protein [Trichoderma camerunense]
MSKTNNNASNTGDRSLLELLRSAYVTKPRSKETFIPRLQFARICTFEAVKRTLIAEFPGREDSFYESYASAICGKAADSSDGIAACPHTSAPSESGQSTIQSGSIVDEESPTRNNTVVAHPRLKIFAILVLIGHPRLIEPFLEQLLCDDLLPFTCSEDFMDLRSSEMSLTSHIQLPQDCDRFAIIKGFCNEQWSVLVPHFDGQTADNMRFEVYDLHEKKILPIIKVSEERYAGGYGLVERIWIHEEHHDFKHTSFALKTMHPFTSKEGDSLFQQELDAFRKVNPGGHVVEICAAIKQGDHRSFLFPWAEGGNLSDLWRRAPRDIIESAEVRWPQFSRWVCIQCHGIIKDLMAIHERFDDANKLFGIHSDIKPDNILHFLQDDLHLGSLKISDLGLMKFHRQASRTKKSLSMGNAYQTYRSPEHDKGRMRSRKIDIWAFGCLFAEFLTWVIRGHNGIEVFKTRRMQDDREPGNSTDGEWLEDNFFVWKSFITIPKSLHAIPKSIQAILKSLHTIPKRKKSIQVSSRTIWVKT